MACLKEQRGKRKNCTNSPFQAGSQRWSLCPRLPLTSLPPTPDIAVTPHHTTFDWRIFISPAPCLSLTLIIYFFVLRSSLKKNRYNRQWKNLQGDRERIAHIQHSFKLKNVSYELLWVIGVSVLRAKFLCSFVDSCGAAA